MEFSFDLLQFKRKLINCYRKMCKNCATCVYNKYDCIVKITTHQVLFIQYVVIATIVVIIHTQSKKSLEQYIRSTILFTNLVKLIQPCYSACALTLVAKLTGQFLLCSSEQGL